MTACSTCSGVAVLVLGTAIYPHRSELAETPFWRCEGCGGYVGCHPGTERPLGTCAGPELRRARSLLHVKFDPLWKSAPTGRRRYFAREAAYALLSERLGVERVRFGEMDLPTCRAAWRALDGITDRDVLDKSNSMSFRAVHAENRFPRKAP